MKRLFVISRLTAHGVRNHDSDNLSEYTELGWELYSTGLHAKEMILRGNITKDDVVMTMVAGNVLQGSRHRGDTWCSCGQRQGR